MNAAGEFSRMLQEQEEIVSRLSRFKLSGNSHNSAMLMRLGEKEKKVAAELKTLKEQIIKNANSLPPQFKKLKNDALRFTKKLKHYEILPELDKAHKNAASQRGNKAYIHGEKALEQMRRLADKDDKDCKSATGQGGGGGNSFSQMMRGKLPGGISERMKKTAKQMLKNILRQCQDQGTGKGGVGSGGSQGGGAGDGEDGHSVNSSSMLDIPIMGPERTDFQNPNAPAHSKMRSGGKGRGGKRGRIISSETKERLIDTKQITTETDSISLDETPHKYRDAVKKYFGEE